MSQFFYVHPDNPQARLINQAVAIVRNGGVVVYPTDAELCFGCQLENKQALEHLFVKIRRIDDKHNFLMRDLSELSLYARVDNVAFVCLKAHTPGAYTFICHDQRSAKAFDEHDVKPLVFVYQTTDHLDLLEAMGEPLMSTSLILPG
ncbi:Sua5/YciO/YrdC/YwlC family protein [Vibrio chagasii]|nr:Sua5/YciO/YrdC/YwlC family protein [Vibrio chagasii]